MTQRIRTSSLAAFLGVDGPFVPSLSPSPLIAARPFVTLGAHLNVLTKWSWTPDRVLTHLPSCVKSQQRSVLSSLTEKRYLPPGWNANALTQLSWPVSVLRQEPRASYTRIDLSLLPVAMNCAAKFDGGGFFSLARAARCGYAAAGASTAHSTTCSWPMSVNLVSGFDVERSHRRAARSSPAERR